MTRYRKAPRPRHDLPERRFSETRKITTKDGHTFYLSVGYDPIEPLRPREVFYSSGFKSGSALEFQLQDTCVLISLLLQHGLKPEKIAKSLARRELPEGGLEYSSLTGLILAEIGEAPSWA